MFPIVHWWHVSRSWMWDKCQQEGLWQNEMHSLRFPSCPVQWLHLGSIHRLPVSEKQCSRLRSTWVKTVFKKRLPGLLLPVLSHVHEQTGACQGPPGEVGVWQPWIKHQQCSDSSQPFWDRATVVWNLNMSYWMSTFELKSVNLVKLIDQCFFSCSKRTNQTL